ncbi:hypothetical protein HPB50_013197 [Hyalomma asiaticum]|uniref:Uncharacterized protein n=1 Tax=Hyalomma asiaticum TaxID=266040 RepID=A0ACB7THE5_HYAAI|nr:hypothetical protein HPB50_013197 [Hyalomma asiaticum]
MSRSFELPHHRSVARCAGVAVAAAQAHERRGRPRLHFDHSELRVSALGLQPHPPVQNHQRLPRQRKQSSSEHPQRAGVIQLPSGILLVAFIRAPGYDDQRLKVWTALSNWAHWNVPRQERLVKAYDQLDKARNSVLFATELSSRRVKGSTAAAVTTTRRVKDFAGFGLPSERKDGRHWLPSAVHHSRSLFVQWESWTICIIDFGQVSECNKDESLRVLVLLNQALGQAHGQLLLVECLGRGTSNANALASCFLLLRTTSRRIPRKGAFQLALVFIAQNTERFLGCENPQCLRLKKVFQLLGMHLKGSPRETVVPSLKQACEPFSAKSPMASGDSALSRFFEGLEDATNGLAQGTVDLSHGGPDAISGPSTSEPSTSGTSSSFVMLNN